METLHESEAPGNAGSSKPMKPNRMVRGIAVCSWLYLVLVVAAWAMIHVGDVWWPATVLLFSPRWLLAIPFFPLSFAAARWRRRSLVVILLALLLILGPVMGFHIAWRPVVSAIPTGEHLRVFTCNIHYHKPHRNTLEQLFAEFQPDVVAIQELPSQEPFDYFDAKEWHFHRRRRFVLASRYPIRDARLLGDASTQVPGSIMRYELETPAGIVTLFSLHFASPRDGLYQTTHHPVTGTGELEGNSAVRWQQSKNLVRLAEDVTGPVLLMGDFNTPSESALFRHVWSRYTDAFAEAGWGWGYTFLGAKTTVRIDHILAGPGWYCERCWVASAIGSPHRPVLADLILRNPQE